MPQVEFEPKISVFQWAKTSHALDRAAAVIGKYRLLQVNKRTEKIFIRSAHDTIRGTTHQHRTHERTDEDISKNRNYK
jgi:hypothetical protein